MAERPVTIDIAICTWNRSALLAETLRQIERLDTPPATRWRVLVVNNNSTDATGAVLADAARRLPLTSVFEERPGLANARNRAVAASSADYLVWTDDDVLVDAEWLSAYRRAFDAHPRAAFFGGPVEPWFEGDPPRWLAEHWPLAEIAFAVRQFGSEPFRLDSGRLPFGANCAVRVDVQRRFPYDPALGRRPGSGLSGEETTLFRQMLAEGHGGWWVPDARVRHFIPRERQSVGYLRRIFGGQGELQGRALDAAGVPRLLGRPRWLLRQALAAEARYRWRRLTAPPQAWLEDLIEASRSWGRLRAHPRRPVAEPIRGHGHAGGPHRPTSVPE
jgi:hypothetical protein